MDIYATIAANLSILDNLDSVRYPELRQLKEKTTVFDHLRGFMMHMRSYSFPVWPQWNPKFFVFAQDYCAAWCRDNLGIKGTPAVWQSHKVLLYDMGLIKLFSVVGSHPNDEILNRTWIEAVRTGFRSTTYWSVPEYTDEVLENAEKIISLYRSQKASLSKLTKNDIIRIRGQERANQIYKGDTARVISRTTIKMEALIKEFLDGKLAEQGYATVNQIEPAVMDLCYERFGIALRNLSDEPVDLGAPQPELTRVQKEHLFALYHLLKQKQHILQRLGYNYGPISNEKREKYNIPTELKCWVITRE